MCLTYAANEITKEKRDLLDLVRSLDVDTPQTYVVRILTDKREKSDKEQKVEIIHEAIKTLRSRRERLRGMIELSESLVSSIDEDIKSLEQSICE